MKPESLSSTSVPNILIVDDIVPNLKLLDEILKPAGYRTRLVPNGELALLSVEKEKPDLILLDIMMPEMDGIEVCRRLKANPGFQDIPVIFISALGATSDIVSALNAGGVDYINKPFQAEEVMARVKTHLKLRLQSKQLQELNATKDIFFSIIAHDLRGPFNGFLGLTKIMVQQSQSMTREEIREYSGCMNETATNLFRLLENLLEWSRMQRNLLSFEPKPIILKNVVRESIAAVGDAAEKKEIEIKYEIPGDLEVIADTGMIASIIRNLVSNAVKFSHRFGKITIAAKPVPGQMVEISVQDNGIGMDSDMVSGLFRLDVKTGREGTEGEHSNGLGLHLTRDFIEKHGGKIRVESSEGSGSTFHFTIPESPDREKTDSRLSGHSNDITQIPLKRLKILIADDDKTSGFLLTMSVKKISREILYAKNGIEALDIFRNNPDIDLILMDIAMPLMQGTEAAREIRRLDKEVIIIAQTALQNPGEKQIALESGCNDFVSKPFDENELLELIRKYV